jgi:hypothetical protein
VNAAGARAVDIFRGNPPVGEKLKSRHAPAVKVTAPGQGARVGGKKKVVVSWKATDADHDALSSSLDYSRDGGRHWRPLFVGAKTTRALLPPFLLARSRNARVRVTVSDGFNETVAVSKRFTSLGAPPYVRISTPRSGDRIAAGSALSLEGLAVDSEGKALKNLVWLDGRKRLGRGPRITTMSLRPGAHAIRLTARANGLVGTASVRVLVAAVQPYFVRLKAPKRLSHKAKKLPLVVQTNVPAFLNAAKHRYSLGPKSKRIVLPVASGRKTIRLPLVLSSGGLVTRTSVVVPRS